MSKIMRARFAALASMVLDRTRASSSARSPRRSFRVEVASLHEITSVLLSRGGTSGWVEVEGTGCHLPTEIFGDSRHGILDAEHASTLLAVTPSAQTLTITSGAAAADMIGVVVVQCFLEALPPPRMIACGYTHRPSPSTRWQKSIIVPLSWTNVF
jgi:hypothetical protein